MTASSCRADNPLPCKGRAEARPPGVWFDTDRYVWLWSDGTGIVPVTHCPFCLGPLPNLTAAILRALRERD